MKPKVGDLVLAPDMVSLGVVREDRAVLSRPAMARIDWTPRLHSNHGSREIQWVQIAFMRRSHCGTLWLWI